MGGKHRFFLNGKLVCTAADATYNSGAVGFFVEWRKERPGAQRFLRQVD